LVIALALLASPLAGRAEDAPKAPPPPKWYDTFELHGLVDTYYSANLSHKQSTGNDLRVFDAQNGFQLSYAKLTAQLAPTTPYTVGFRTDIGFGRTAEVLNGGNTVVVEQGFVSFKLPSEIVLDAGKFVTNAGAEVIEAKDNWLYSRSLLFSIIPFTHTGLRATIPVGSGFSLMAGLFNGWDNPPGPVGSEKTGHLALLYSGDSNTSLVFNVLYGRDPGATDDHLLLDVVAGRSFGDLSLNLNADYNKIADAKIWGVAAMARYSLAGDKARLSARGELLNNSNGFPGFGGGLTKYYELTGGLSVPVGGNAEVRAEVRADFTSDPVLTTDRKNQVTFQLAALAWF
jgi:hypothetical protein